MIKVFKFGGASVRDAAAVRNLSNILTRFRGVPLVVVVSAMGKTTNALEQLLAATLQGESSKSGLIANFKAYHDEIVSDLFPEGNQQLNERLQRYYNELEDQLQNPDPDYFDRWYDQVVSIGELISTLIVSYWLNAQGLRAVLCDARQYVITDDRYRSANVDWQATCQQTANLVPMFQNADVLIVQGFLGRTTSGFTTTLGREGSDYSAAIFAYCLNAMDVTIWKDVPGLLNADPKRLPNTVKLEAISYSEAIELSYYGATVIHPKTIKPLQNKKIPLYIRSFVHFNEPPSVISDNNATDTLIPSYIFKEHQLLVSISLRDFSFMDEKRLETVFGRLSEERIHSNLVQTSALSLSICIDNSAGLPERIMHLFGNEFFIKYNHDLTLLTIRHYDESQLQHLVRGRKILLEQRSRTTLQFVMGD